MVYGWLFSQMAHQGVVGDIGLASSTSSSSTPTNAYVLEDGVTFYVAEDNATYYVQEM